MDKTDYFLFGMLGGAVLVIVGVIILKCIIPPITPIDVYHGKTTLKYEVVDGVKVDSIVVWKENFKK